MKKLWRDLRSDAERSDYILSGQAYDAGVIAHAIQADVALAFHRCSEYGSEVRQLREENERQRFDILAMNQSLDLLRQENERLRVQLAGCGVARSTDRNARLVNQCRDHDTRRAAAVAQCAAMAEEIQQLNETITALTRESRDAQEM